MTADKQGTLADIDGQFQIHVKQLPAELTFTVLGYETRTITVYSYDDIRISLQPSALKIKEVVIRPTENPAWRIIRLAQDNRDRNNPEKGKTFTYNSYNKTFFTIDPGTIQTRKDSTGKESAKGKAGGVTVSLSSTGKDSTRSDSAKKLDMRAFFDSTYLFFTETYAKRTFYSKDFDKEVILANRVSGFKNPTFGMLGSQFQSFTFYQDLINIYNKNYLSPISNNSEYSYLFELVDTAYIGKDTVFIITFEPRSGKNFDALKGKLYINTSGYAIQQALAEPVVKATGKFNARIQQQYKQVGGVWFPEQLNTWLSMNPNKSENGSGSFDFVGEIRSYLDSIQINPPMRKRDAGGISNDMASDAAKKDSTYWMTVRQKDLSSKELNTYHLVDSVSQAENLETKLKWIEYLIDGQIPYGPVSFILNDIVKFNSVEGTRLGLGLTTNNRLSRWFAVGGAFGYGFKDHRWKYRGDASIYFDKDKRWSLNALYKKDLIEPGSNPFQRMKLGMAATENLRQLGLNRMDEIELAQIGLKGRLGNSLTLEPFVARELRTVSGYDYKYAYKPTEGLELQSNQFLSNQFGVNLRYAYAEKYARFFGRVIPVSARYPILQMRITNVQLLNSSEQKFLNVSAQVDHKFLIKLGGEVTWRVNAGITDQTAPYQYLFNGRANLSPGKIFGVSSFGSFETMNFNEFLSDRFVSANVFYDFKSLLLKTKNFNPGIVLVASAMVGDLRDASVHREINFKVPNKGYYEGGLMITNLYKSAFSALGIGVYYRMGPYQMDKTIDNFAFKINTVVAFD